VSDLVLSSNGVDHPEPTSIEVLAALDMIPDDVQSEAPSGESSTAAPPGVQPLAILEPWAAVNVDWVLPFAGMLLKLPYEQAAKYTKDDCWLVTDDQVAIINPAMEKAIQWTVWKLGAANAVSHPLVAFGVALGSLTAVKWGVYKFHESQIRAGGPAPSQRQNQPPTPMATSTTNGRTAESGGVSSSAANQEAAKATSSKKGFVVAGE
jgi:hypothetical protein